jgi:hypothetical protein
MSDESWEFIARLDGQSISLTSNRDAAAPVPEPATMLLMGTGLASLIGGRFRRKKA